MNSVYYQTIDKMEKAKVARDYLVGWASGFLHNPKVEEQRQNEAYDAGYDDGMSKKTDGYTAWAGK